MQSLNLEALGDASSALTAFINKFCSESLMAQVRELKGLSIRVIKSYKNKIPSETKWKKASVFLEENKQKQHLTCWLWIKL